MPSLSTPFAVSLLQLEFNGTAIAGVATNATTSPQANWYIALHTGDPGVTGDQTVNEANYTGYARVAVPRTTAGFTVSTNGNVATVNPAAQIAFPQGTGGGGTATYWSIGIAATGAGTVTRKGPISPTITMGSTITPILSTATNITEA